MKSSQFLKQDDTLAYGVSLFDVCLGYKYTGLRADVDVEGWSRQYHGTFWYAVPSIMTMGLKASDGSEVGHTFLMGRPGVYASHELEVARRYARAQRFEPDGVYYSMALVVLVSPDATKVPRRPAAPQTIGKSGGVLLYGALVFANVRLDRGGERMDGWADELVEPMRESRPRLFEQGPDESMDPMEETPQPWMPVLRLHSIAREPFREGESPGGQGISTSPMRNPLVMM